MGRKLEAKEMEAREESILAKPGIGLPLIRLLLYTLIFERKRQAKK